MAKVKNIVIHIKKGLGHDCEWKTFYEEDEVPGDWKELFLKQGGVFEEEVEQPKEVESLEERDEEPQKDEVKYTEEGLFAMNKAEQVDLLNELGAEKIPKFEKARVKLILELQ